MVDLSSKTPAAGLLPVTHGASTLTETDPGVVTSLMPYPGQRAAFSAALEAAHGLAFPEANRVTRAPGALCQWAGRGQALLIGPVPDVALAGQGAVTDVSDAWVTLRLEGAVAAAVLARLVPIDLRPGAFGPDACARTLCQHVSVALRRDETAFEVMAFRSMAGTLVHEIADAMAAVAARGVSG